MTYKIHATQGQGDIIVHECGSLSESLKYVEDHKGEASFAIEYPDGTYHSWAKYHDNNSNQI